MSSKKVSRKDAKTQSREEELTSKKPKTLGVSASLREPEKQDAKPALVPKLRFPEFREADGWEAKRLEELVDIQSGATPSKANPAFWNGSVPWVSAKDMKRMFLEDAEDHISDAAIDDGARLVPPGTLLMLTRGMTLLKDVPICLMRREMCFNQDVKGLRPKDGVDGLFLAWMLTGNKQRLLAMVDIAGHGTGKLDTDELKAMELMLPAPFEQQQIAECLSSVDELMAAQARKVDALKTHKKGLMQQLFPREGETQPRRRFREFQNAGEWVCEEISKCLKKVIDYRGKAPPKAEAGVPLITAKNVRFGWLDMTNDEYIEEHKYEEWMSRGIPQTGDILFTTEAPLGNVALFPPSGKFALGQRLLTLRSKSERCVPAFLFHSLLGPTMQEEIDFHGTGSTAKGIKSKVFVKLSFCHPGVQEQQRIADCLTSLDDLIAAQTQKLEALKTHKKGLMQQLFPSPEGD